eukprot:3777150-Rhodomonas_salina.2
MTWTCVEQDWEMKVETAELAAHHVRKVVSRLSLLSANPFPAAFLCMVPAHRSLLPGPSRLCSSRGFLTRCTRSSFQHPENGHSMDANSTIQAAKIQKAVEGNLRKLLEAKKVGCFLSARVGLGAGVPE